tara:strand:- start:645 stop:1724 length:1080 start_codon:yes stop_codon:yes gene_type:complete
MKKLDKYIIGQFLSNFILSILAFLIIFLLVDLIDRLDKFIDNQMPNKDIINYYILTIPWFISISMPMALLLSTVFSIGILQKRNEITAIKASGISIKRIGSSFLIIGVLFSMLLFYFDNNIVTKSIHYRTELEDKYFKKNKHSIKRKQNIHRQINDNNVLIINKYSYKKNTASNVSILSFNNGNLYSRIDADKMIWNNEIESWKIPYYTKRIFNKNKLIFTSIVQDTILNLNFSPIDLTKESVKPEEMNYFELKDFVKKIKSNGIKEPKWEVNLHFKSAFACSSFLMILFGLSLSVKKPRSNIGIGIGLSIFTIFLYYAALKFGQALGYKGILNPFISVWNANFIFLIIGIYLYSKSRT